MLLSVVLLLFLCILLSSYSFGHISVFLIVVDIIAVVAQGACYLSRKAGEGRIADEVDGFKCCRPKTLRDSSRRRVVPPIAWERVTLLLYESQEKEISTACSRASRLKTCWSPSPKDGSNSDTGKGE